MTIPGFLVINLFVGVSVAYAARIQIRTLQRPLFFSRYFSALMMLELMILLPIGAYFYAFYPDWSWMYLVDTTTANAAIGVMTVICLSDRGADGLHGGILLRPRRQRLGGGDIHRICPHRFGRYDHRGPGQTALGGDLCAISPGRRLETVFIHAPLSIRNSVVFWCYHLLVLPGISIHTRRPPVPARLLTQGCCEWHRDTIIPS